MRKSQVNNKIIKSFYVVGINELKLQRYNITNNIDESLRFIQKIDILNTNYNIKNERYDSLNEKWIRVLNSPNSWLRFEYSDHYLEPITDLRIAECDYHSSNNYILLPRKYYQEGYRPVKLIKHENTTNNIKDIPRISQEERSFQKLDERYILIPSEYNSKFSLSLPTKKKAALLMVSRKTYFLPIKAVIIQKNKENKSYTFHVQRHKSPYLFKYLPEVLDFYPLNDTPNKAVAMFCFPEGVMIKNRFDTPKCFNFVLTDEIGERTFGSTFIFVQELSISLREAFIPSYNEPNKTYYYEKAICVLSKYPFYYNCLSFLKEIYNIIEPKSSGKIPIERAICAFVDTLYLQSYDKLLRFNINDKELDFYRVANYGKMWDTNDKYLETLFRLLSYEQIITAWSGLLLEKKLYLICTSKAALSQVAHGLIDLLFPFNWIHVYVPILPEKLRLFIESPVPAIIGISFHIEINELPNDSLILNINKNCFEKYKEKVPPLPQRLHKLLMTKLNKLKEQYNLDNPQYVDKIMTNIDEAVIYLGPDMPLFQKIDVSEIRDAFYNVFINMFKNYEKYFNWLKQSVNLIGSQSVFLKDIFLKDFNSLDKNSFLYLFSETSLFSQFVDSFGVDESNISSSFAFFLESIKKGKGKNKYFLQNIIPKNVIFAPTIDINDLNDKKFNYPEFPEFNKKLFISHEIPTAPKKSKFLYLFDEWCYSTEKLKLKDWPKYFLYLIYDIWFTFFSFVLNIYEDNQAIIMMDYALSLIEFLSEQLKIPPTRNLFSKIIKSCGRNSLNPFIKQMLIMVKNINKGKGKYNSLFHNDYLNGIYFLTQNVSHNSLSASLTNSGLLMNTIRSTIISQMRESKFSIDSQLNNIIFIYYNICENCLMSKGIVKIITFDEILSGYIMKKNDDNTSICSSCLSRFEPKIYYLEKKQTDLNLKEVNFYSPMELIKTIDEIIQKHGEIYFYRENEWSEIYWNIIFYFELFDLPTCVLYIQNNMEKFEKIKNKLKENKKRKFASVKEKKTTKLNFFMGKLNKTSNDVREDVSLDTTKLSNNISTNTIISDTSFNSVKNGNAFASNTEMDIWTMYYYMKKQNQKKDSNENANIKKTNEDKIEIISRLKETKAFMNDNISYFISNSQEKLKIFVSNYDKLERLKQHDYVNMCFKKENEKYEKGTTLKKANPTPKPNQENSPNIQNSNVKRDDFSINTRYDFNIRQKAEIVNDNKDNNSLIKENITIREKIPLDNTSKITKNRSIMKQETMENNIINNENNINISFKEDINNINQIKGIHSPQKKMISTNIYSSNNSHLNSSKVTKIKTMNFIDNNINNKLNMNINREENLNPLNNEKYKNNNTFEKGNITYLNQNNNNNNSIPRNYSNETENIQNRNNILNKKYGNTTDIRKRNNIEESNIPRGNNQNLKYSSNNLVENYPQQLNDIQNKNQFQKPNSQRYQNYQVNPAKTKYQFHKVPAYKSIFDQNNNV